MLMVLFQLGRDRYAVDARCVVEIVPLVDVKALPHAPEYVAGLFNYHSAVVPVLDLCRLMQQRACSPFLSSRTILIDYGKLTGAPPGTRILGLLAEQVTEIVDRSVETQAAPVKVEGAPYLDGVFFHDGGINQCLKPAALLPEELREMLFAETLASDSAQ